MIISGYVYLFYHNKKGGIRLCVRYMKSKEVWHGKKKKTNKLINKKDIKVGGHFSYLKF